VWIGGLAGLLTIFIQWKNASRINKYGSALLLLFIFSTLISILKGGAAYEHYLIQLVPFMALSAAVFLNASYPGKAGWPITATLLFVIVTSMLSVFPEYEKVASRFLSGKSVTYGVQYEIAAFLKQQNAARKPIYMMTDNIVYWLLDENPMSRSTTHPSNIAKEFLLNPLVGPGTTTEMELARLLAKNPRFIVTEKDIWYLRNKPDAQLLLEANLKLHYELVKQIGGRNIFCRKQQP
jgi:hypothetical protein